MAIYKIYGSPFLSYWIGFTLKNRLENDNNGAADRPDNLAAFIADIIGRPPAVMLFGFQVQVESIHIQKGR